MLRMRLHSLGMAHVPTKTAETPLCTASPQRAAHALGSHTGRRSSPGGRRNWGRGRGRPVCRSSRVRTWGIPFSCLQTSTKRQGTASYYSFWQDGAGGSCHPAHARACARVPPVCLDRRRALPPQLRGVAELKFVLTKCRPHPVHFSADRWRISHAPTHKIALAA